MNVTEEVDYVLVYVCVGGWVGVFVCVRVCTCVYVCAWVWVCMVYVLNRPWASIGSREKRRGLEKGVALCCVINRGFELRT